MTRKPLILSVLALGVAVFAVAAWYVTRPAPVAVTASVATEEAEALVRAYSPVLGPEEAPVTIVEFFDPACEACRAFYPVVKDIMAKHGDAVRVVLRYTPFHGAASEEAIKVLEAARMWQVDGPGAPEPLGQLPVTLSSMDFRLTDHEGQPVGPETLIGRASMVFFSFTYCPDVCPTTLSDISGWLEAMGEDAGRLNVVFITVDPERDTPEAMAEYVGYFNPAIRGWTGPEDQIARAAQGFRASYERVPTEGGDYTMNHTASVFLFDADGRFVSTIDYHEPREVAVPKIRRAINEEARGAS